MSRRLRGQKRTVIAHTSAIVWGDRVGRRFVLTALKAANTTGIVSFTPDQGSWVAGRI